MIKEKHYLLLDWRSRFISIFFFPFLFFSLQRNQFLEAESIELEKERTQIRFEMRNLLVNNEDLLRMNTQLQAELKRMRDRIVELESDNNVMVERFKQIDVRSAAFSSVRAMLV